MKKMRIVLLPFSWIYGLIIGARNLLYDKGFLKSYPIPKKSICIGNLSVGGTGKTPHVDYIVNHYIDKGIEVSTLSRGYGRTTKGLLEVTNLSSAKEVGDEPLLYKLKHEDKLHVIVAESRKNGVEYIQSTFPENRLIVLDDAYQHRAVQSGLSILISDYNHLFFNDYLLPVGSLREGKQGVRRADIIVISKCPANISREAKNNLVQAIKFDSEKVFFSNIAYGKLLDFHANEAKLTENVLLVTGIGNPTPLVEHLSGIARVTHLKFKDHHLFTAQDIARIHEKFDTFAPHNKAIVTTEKDFMRLKSIQGVNEEMNRWFYQPIAVEFDEEQKFKLLIDKYVIEN